MLRFSSILSVALALPACSGSTDPGVSSSSSSGGSSSGNVSASEADALFEAPSGNATADSIHGLWGGSAEDSGIAFDFRIRLAPSTLFEAVRCSKGTTSTPTAAVSVKARVSDDEIAVLESRTDEKRAGDVWCKAAPRPATVSRCSGDAPKGFEKNCFTLDGTRLVVYGEFPSDAMRLTKLSD